jgi:hypothetical protein
VCVCERERERERETATVLGVWLIAEKFIGDRHECSPAVKLTNNNNKNLQRVFSL